MPSTVDYAVNRQTNELAEKEFKERLDSFELHYRYMTGQQPKPLKIDIGQPDDNVILNMCKTRTQRVVDLVAGAGFPLVQITPDDGTLSEQINKIWVKAGGDNWLKQAVETGALNGQVFVKVIAPNPEAGEMLPRLVLLTNIIKWVKNDDPSQVLWYEQRWAVDKKVYKQDTVNRGNFWEIYEYLRDGQDWKLVKDVMTWDAPLAPIVDVQHLPNSRGVYGNSEFDNLPLQDSINKVASEINRILRFHAYPRTVGIGFEAGAVQQTAINSFWTIPNENARIQNLEMQSDLTASREHLKTLTRQFYSEAGLFYDDTPDTEPKTATAVIREHEPQLNKQRTLRQQYALLIENVDKVLGYVLGAGEIEVDRMWGTTPLEAAMNLYRLDFAIRNGLVSKQTAAKELGYSYEKELERMTDEALVASTLTDGFGVGVSG